MDIAQQCADDEETLLGAMRYLYWCVPEVKASSISKVLGVPSPNQISTRLGNVKVRISCDRCGNDLSVKSRTELQERLRDLYKVSVRYAEGYTILCDSCREQVYTTRHEKQKAEEQRRLDRERDLATMPYTEYLKSPEWRERRSRMLRSVGYRCQLCNRADKTLHVHHRTYERRGDELYKDLIVLCEECHRIHHFGQ